MKRYLVASIVLLAILFGAPLYVWVNARSLGIEPMKDEWKNNVVAACSELTARWVPTNDLEPVRYADANPYGINVFLEQEVEEAKKRRTLEMVRDAGFKWVKQQVLWSDIEQPAKGQYYDEKVNVPNTWTKYDQIVDLCREYGLGLIARLDTSPQWARPGNPKLETPPDNFDDYGDFVHNVVSRYKGKVKYFQIWNEPNLSDEWGDRPVSAADYVKLLKIAYTRAKEANPDAVIIVAALAPTADYRPEAVNDLLFLQQMYDAGARDYFDIGSVNAYGLGDGPFDRRMDVWSDVNFSRPILVRELMVRNGDSAKPIWASEMGWNALPPDYPDPPLWSRVTRDQQARYTVEALQRAQKEWPWMGVMNLWYLRTVHDVNATQQRHFFSLIDNDFTPFPLYWAVRDLAALPPTVEYGYHQESLWALHYSGQWHDLPDEQASLDGLKVAEAPGDKVDFTFRGTDLEFVLSGGPASGSIEVTIDGLPANRLKNHGGKGFLDLYRPDETAQERVPIAGQMDDATHRVEVTVSTDKNAASTGHQVAIDGVVVDRKTVSPRARLAKVALPLGLPSAVVAVLSLVGFVRRRWPR